MKVTVVSAAGTSTDIDIAVEDSLEELQVLIEVALSVPIAQQALTIDINGTVVPVPPTIAPSTQIKSVAAQLFPGGLSGPIIVRVADKSQPVAAPAASVDDEILRLFAAGRQQQQQHPAPARRARNGSAAAAAGAAATGMLDDDAAFDPLDPEVQRRMMEEFRLRAVDENLRQALEHTPEAFGSIWMLYVPTAVNGVKINAFVDSGAQMTIMSEFMAEKCNLTRLIDRRHQGVAKGVGESKITGVVHLATVQMGGVFLPMRITILESKGMDFLIGLDQLRRHQMCIDMRACVLRLDDKTAIPFLSEPEIEEMKQRHALEEAQSERLRDQNRVEEEKVRAARPQRSPQHGPATAGSSDAAASGNTATTPPALTDEQNEKVNTLVGAFGVPPGVARSALEAAQWDADSAVTFLGL